MDPLTDAYLAHMESEHRKARYVADMPALAAALGIPLLEGEHSIATKEAAQIKRHIPRQEKRAVTAHELVHVLADRAKLTDKVRREHASAPDIDDHLEELTDHGSDRLLMPKFLISELLSEYGDTARSVWELSIAADVRVEQAMRRWVHLRPGRRAAFLLSQDYIYYAISTFWVPVWIGSSMDVEGFLEAGGSIYRPDEDRAFAIAFSCSAD